MSYYVYALCSPAGTPFYIGKGKGQRIFNHERKARKGVESHTARKIRSIMEAGGEIQRQILWDDLSEEDAFTFERFAIATLGMDNLTNKTAGGEGKAPLSPIMGRKHNEETKRKMSESHRGKRFTEEHCSKIAIAKRGMKQSDEHRRKNGDARRGTHHSEEQRKKISLSLKGSKRTEEQCRNIMESQRERRRLEREGMLERAPVTEEARENMRLAQIRRRTRERIGDSPGILLNEHIARQRAVGDV
jgi:hypothetical protein